MSSQSNPGVFELTWTFPENFGGMTSVLLHRAKAYGSVADVPVTILTLGSDVDVQRETRILTGSGKLGPQVTIRNLWEELASMTDEQLARFSSRSSGVLTEEMPPDRAEEAERTRTNADGALLEVHRYRSDSTCYVADRRDTRTPGTPGGRRLTLWSRSNRPLGQFSSASQLYFAWLDHVFGDQDAWLTVDSLYAAGVVHHYRRPTVTTAVALHSTHLDSRDGDPLGKVAPSKFKLLRNLESFDLVAVLTDGQTRDMKLAGFGRRRLHTIPNSRNFAVPESPQRPRFEFLVVARLSAVKRLEDAVRAIAILLAQEVPVSLTIYGDGDRREPLETLATELGVQGSVHFKGHDPAAAQEFGNFRFSLLTSHFEGQPLSIIEAMASGCVPVAYDIKYGPSDMITHDKTGFLVRPGDVQALAETMLKATKLSDSEFGRMSEEAKYSAAKYSDSTVIHEWLDAFDRTSRARRGAADIRVAIDSAEATTTAAGLSAKIVVAGQGTNGELQAQLCWSSATSSILGLEDCAVSMLGPGRASLTCSIAVERLPQSEPLTLELKVSGAFGGQLLALRNLHTDYAAEQSRHLALHSDDHGTTLLRSGASKTTTLGHAGRDSAQH